MKRLSLLILVSTYIVNAFAQHNTFTYNGNVFETKVWSDTTTVIDPETGKEVIKVTTGEPEIVKMNGKKIHVPVEHYTGEKPDTTVVVNAETGEEALKISMKYSNWEEETIEKSSRAFKANLLKALAPDIKKLPDGYYEINITNIVIDEYGKVAYCKMNGFTKTSGLKSTHVKAIEQKITAYLQKPQQALVFEPKGYPVIYKFTCSETIKVKSHSLLTR